MSKRSKNQREVAKGVWSAAIPIPIYVLFFKKCPERKCGKLFLSKKKYQNHYYKTHTR